MAPKGPIHAGRFSVSVSNLPAGHSSPLWRHQPGTGDEWRLYRRIGIGPIAGNAVVAKFGSFPAASAAVSLLFIVGMVSIWFGPETKGVPLDN